jgi:hypothetical protein
MSSFYGWDNPEKTIYRVEFNERWTWGDFSTTIGQAYAAIERAAEEQNHRVDIIFCFNSKLPPGNALPHVRRMGGSQPPNIYRTVIVSKTDQFLQLIIRTIDRTMGWEGPAMVRTLEEARALLKEVEDPEVEAG